MRKYFALLICMIFYLSSCFISLFLLFFSLSFFYSRSVANSISENVCSFLCYNLMFTPWIFPLSLNKYLLLINSLFDGIFISNYCFWQIRFVDNILFRSHRKMLKTKKCCPWFIMWWTIRQLFKPRQVIDNHKDLDWYRYWFFVWYSLVRVWQTEQLRIWFTSKYHFFTYRYKEIESSENKSLQFNGFLS